MKTNKNQINIIIADDQFYFRRGLIQALSGIQQFNFVAEAGDGRELCQLTEKYLPDIILTDVSMPIINGIEATKFIKKRFPKSGIIGISMFSDLYNVREMIFAGANGYLLKNSDITEVSNAIKTVNIGKFHISNLTADYFTNMIHSKSNDAFLTKRETDVVRLLFEELTSREIGEKLFLSERTVEDYRKKIQKKIGASNVVGIMKYALKHKIVGWQN